MKLNITRETPILRTGRALQLEGLFDVPPAERSALAWDCPKWAEVTRVRWGNRPGAVRTAQPHLHSQAFWGPGKIAMVVPVGWA